MPLMWAHAEYIKLLRSAEDGQVFDLIPEVAERYLKPRERAPIEFWKLNRQAPIISVGVTLRIQAARPFMLHWGRGEWTNPTDTLAQETAIGMSFVDLATHHRDLSPLRFTFLWLDDNRWEGRDYTVRLRES
jgi:glucoamylase